MTPVVLLVCGLAVLCAAENVIKTKPGGTATFKCGLTVSSSILKWQRGPDTLYTTNPRTGMPSKGKTDIAQRSQLKNERDLVISRIKTEDAGLFTCATGGQEEQHILVVASVSVSPSSPIEAGSSAVLQCNVASLDPGSVVQWVGPNGQRNSSQRFELKSVALRDGGQWKCVFNAAGQEMSETLTIQVTEPRPKTTAPPLTSRPPACFDCGDSTTSATPTLGGLSWWMWAAVGGGCLVIVLLWVLVLVLYNRMTRRKRRFMKLRNGGQLMPKQYCQCPCPAAAPGGRREPSAPPLPPLPMQCYQGPDRSKAHRKK